MIRHCEALAKFAHGICDRVRRGFYIFTSLRRVRSTSAALLESNGDLPKNVEPINLSRAFSPETSAWAKVFFPLPTGVRRLPIPLGLSIESAPANTEPLQLKEKGREENSRGVFA